MDEHPSCPGHKSSPCVKGVIIDGVISCDDNVVKKAIKDFWESLLSTERPYNKDSLDELIADHHLHFPPVERHDVAERKLINFFKEPITPVQDLIVSLSLCIR